MTIKDVGYVKKEIKDAYQRRYATCSKGMFKKKRIGHMKVQVIKKRVGHMKVQVFKKRKKKRDSPCPKKNGERWFMKRSSSTIHKIKIFTHLHILIKDYDLLLLWIRSLT